MFHWGTVTIFWISYLHKGKKLRKQQEPEQQRSAYFLGWPIYISIFLSDCVRILVTSQSEKLDQRYGRYGDQEILLAITCDGKIIL